MIDWSEIALDGYGRVSGEGQEDERTVEDQVADIERWSKAHGVALRSMHLDNPAKSMTKLDARKGGAALLRAARSGGIHGVVLQAFDRLGRSHYLGLAAEELFRHVDFIISVSQGVAENNEAGWLLLETSGLISGAERRRIIARMASGKRKWGEEGYKVSGGTRYGYITVRDENKRVVYAHDDAVIPHVGMSPRQLVERTFQLLALERRSASFVCDWMEEHQVPTPTAQRRRKRAADHWGPPTVLRIVRDPIYLGVTVAGRQIAPAIVTPEIQAAAIRQIGENRNLPKATDRDYPLSGLIVCGECTDSNGRPTHYIGKPIPTTLANGEVVEYTYMRCSAGRKSVSKKTGRPQCPNPTIPSPPAFDYSWEVVRGFLQNPSPMLDTWEAEYRSRAGNGDAKVEIERMQTQLADTEARIGQVMDAYESRAYTLEQLRERKPPLDRHAASLRSEIAAAQAKVQAAGNVNDARRIIEEAVDGLRESVQGEVDYDQKRALVRALVREIRVYEPGSVDSYTAERASGLRLPGRLLDYEANSPVPGMAVDGYTPDGRAAQMKTSTLESRGKAKAVLAVTLALPDPAVLPTEWPYSLLGPELRSSPGSRGPNRWARSRRTRSARRGSSSRPGSAAPGVSARSPHRGSAPGRGRSS